MIVEIKSWKIALSFLFLIMFPSYFSSLLGVSSMTPGTLFCAAFLFVANLKRKGFFTIERRSVLLFSTGIFIFWLSGIVGYGFFGDEKSLTSLAIPIIFFSAYVFAKFIYALSDNELKKGVIASVFILVVVGWAGVFELLNFGVYAESNKAVAPFSEQSHFALGIGMLAAGSVVIASKKASLFVILNIFLLSIVFPNLTLLVFSACCFFLFIARFGRRFFLVTSLIVFLIFFPSVYGLIEYIPYFKDRVSLGDTTNLTSLVWLQGWELAFHNFLQSFGVGVGVQRLGLDESQLVETSRLIERLHGKYYNLEDGGFLASKIISEFGIVGSVLLFFYVFKIIQFYFRLRRVDSFPFDASSLALLNKAKFCYGALIAFSVEVFFRGYGYYSPGVYLAISLLFVLFFLKRDQKQKFLFI